MLPETKGSGGRGCGFLVDQITSNPNKILEKTREEKKVKKRK